MVVRGARLILIMAPVTGSVVYLEIDLVVAFLRSSGSAAAIVLKADEVTIAKWEGSV